ncbi:DUF1707 domain-containing protein [Nonomuraea sp. NPDC003754]
MSTDDQLRIGDAERDETMAALREHFAQGRLTREELDERLDLALSARTAGDLARVHADLPGPGRHSPTRDAAVWHGPGAWPDAWRERAPWPEARRGQDAWPGGWPEGAWAGAARWAEEYGQGGSRRARHLRRMHAHRMRHAHLGRRHRGPGPLAPVLLVALVIGLAVSGFSVLKVLFFVWVAAMVFGFAHRRSHLARLGR